MPRLFLGNFDFEHRLADPVRQLPAKLDRINAELAASWMAIADDGDCVWTPQPIEASFFEQAVRDGLPRVLPVVSFDPVPPGVECVPWGWTDDIRRLCDRHGWIRNDPPDAAVRAANSRRLSTSLEMEWGVGLDFAGEVASFQDIERFVAFHGESSRWVVKAEFGMSGRERLIGTGSPTAADRNWIAKRLAADGVLFFEPWVERLDEVGIQIDVPRQGEPRLIGVAPMLVNSRGQYAGSLIRPAEATLSAIGEHSPDWESSIDVALRAAGRIQNFGYFGPLGIDAMRYRDTNRREQFRPLQDINARWTMGRLSLGWGRWFKAEESGYWLHGPEPLSGSPLPGTDSRTNAIGAFREFLLSHGGAFESAEAFDGDNLDLASWVSKELERGRKLVEIVNEFERFLELRGMNPSTVFRAPSLKAAGLIHVGSQIDGRVIYRQLDPQRGHMIRTSPETVGGQPATHQTFLWIDH